MLHDAIAEHVRRRMALPQRRISAEERARDARRAARNLRRPSRERLPWMFKGLGDGTPYVDNLPFCLSRHDFKFEEATEQLLLGLSRDADVLQVGDCPSLTVALLRVS
jgi:hypothetical protein